MKLDEVFNDEYNLTVFKRKIDCLNESTDKEYLNNMYSNIKTSVSNLEKELPALKYQINDGYLELKPLYFNLNNLLKWLKSLLEYMNNTQKGNVQIPNHIKDHPFWSALPSLNQ
jgi:hypothetical protein